jgi:hypothetical protein
LVDSSYISRCSRYGEIAFCHAAEDHASAWARAQEALEFSRRYKEKGQEVWTLHVLG